MQKTKEYLYILDLLKNKKEFKFVIIGDSITSGEWVLPNWRNIFEYILKFGFEELPGKDKWIAEWNLKFFNYSLDGATTKNFRRQVDLALKEVKPDCVILMGTSNDIEKGISVKEHVSNLEKIFKKLARKTKFFVYSPDIYSKDEKLNSDYQPYIVEALKTKGYLNKIVVNGYEESKKFPLEKIFTLKLEPFERKENGPEIDYVHPNQLGNAYLAKMFLEKIFGLEMNPEKYIKDLRSDTVKLPTW